jgi:hypothetical protein
LSEISLAHFCGAVHDFLGVILKFRKLAKRSPVAGEGAGQQFSQFASEGLFFAFVSFCRARQCNFDQAANCF